MLELKVEDKFETNGDVKFVDSDYEGRFVCWGKNQTREGIMQSYQDNVRIANRLVKESKNALENVEYWNNNPDKLLKKWAYMIDELSNEEIEQIKNGTYLKVTWVTRTIRVFDENNTIKEDTFRYAL